MRGSATAPSTALARARQRGGRHCTVLDATYDRYPNNRGSANSNFYLFSLYSLWMLGDLVELAKRRAHTTTDAEQRGDLYESARELRRGDEVLRDYPPSPAHTFSLKSSKQPVCSWGVSERR